MGDFVLHISPEAETCIREQTAWYLEDEKHGGEALASRWLEKLDLSLAKLGAHPERHPFAPENGRWMAGIEIRQMRFKPWSTSSTWRVLFTIDMKKEMLVVLQIRHERRRWLFESGD